MSSSSCEDPDVNTAWMGGLGETVTSGQLKEYLEIVGCSVREYPAVRSSGKPCERRPQMAIVRFSTAEDKQLAQQLLAGTRPSLLSHYNLRNTIVFGSVHPKHKSGSGPRSIPPPPPLPPPPRPVPSSSSAQQCFDGRLLPPPPPPPPLVSPPEVSQRDAVLLALTQKSMPFPFKGPPKPTQSLPFKGPPKQPQSKHGSLAKYLAHVKTTKPSDGDDGDNDDASPAAKRFKGEVKGEESEGSDAYDPDTPSDDDHNNDLTEFLARPVGRYCTSSRSSSSEDYEDGLVVDNDSDSALWDPYNP